MILDLQLIDAGERWQFGASEFRSFGASDFRNLEFGVSEFWSFGIFGASKLGNFGILEFWSFGLCMRFENLLLLFLSISDGLLLDNRLLAGFERSKLRL